MDRETSRIQKIARAFHEGTMKPDRVDAEAFKDCKSLVQYQGAVVAIAERKDGSLAAYEQVLGMNS